MRMKKVIINFMVAAAAVAAISACSNVEQLRAPQAPETTTKRFTVSLDGQTRTEVTLGATGKVQWVAGDSFSVLDGKSNIKVTLTADNISEDGYKADFEIPVTKDGYYTAVYPYSEGNALDPENDEYAIATGVNARQDGNFSSAHIASAFFLSDDDSFQFHNVVGVLHFTLSNPEVAAIALKGNNDEQLSGEIRTTAGDDSAAAEWTGNAPGKSITVAANKSGEYFIGTMETTFSKGFTITYYTSDGKIYGTTTTTRSFELPAGRIVKLGALDSRIKQSEGVTPVTVAEFIALPDSDTENVYELTGVITRVSSSTKGNFYMEDSTGSIYVYGLTDGNGTLMFNKMGLAKGYTVTIHCNRFKYNGTVEAENAVYVSHKAPDSLNDFLEKTTYGIYNILSETTVKAYEEYTEQIGVGATTFSVIDPNNLKYYTVAGISKTAAEGDKINITLTGNYGFSIGTNFSVTVNKIDGSTVWLSDNNGNGFIIKK